jgi:Cu/Zn superoxide dismutase
MLGLSTGPHLNPDNQLHSLPGITANRHLGDFGSIRAYDSSMLL